jgi:hypothetical protein
VKRTKTITGKCGVVDCKRKARAKHACVTCEKLGKPEFAVKCCSEHFFPGLELLKKHALTAHPSNILGAMGAALKGEDVF